MSVLNGFVEKYRNKRIAVVGAGISNLPLIKLLREKELAVSVHDRRGAEALGGDARDLAERGCELHLGEDYLERLDADLVIKTPGLRPDAPALLAAAARGSEITSEMELFYELCPCRTVGVTGSDGKSTTTALVAELLRNSGYKVRLGGNIGKPLFPELEQIGRDEFCVTELSSFQLMTMKKSPHIAVITNISPNHLDWHRDMEEYGRAKENIFRYQSQNDRLVLNFDDETTRSFARRAAAKAVFFSLEGARESDYRYDGRCLCRDGEKLIDRSELLIKGDHNVANFLAAIAACDPLLKGNAARDTATGFGGLAHRIEFVRELGGVKFYNDSIASSPTRTRAMLAAFGGGVVLIAGGYDKKIPFDGFGDEVTKACKAAFLSGATAQKIAAEIRRSDPDFPLFVKESFEDAVFGAAKYAKAGDSVVLSPACASFDRFANFEQRGDYFKKLIGEL